MLWRTMASAPSPEAQSTGLRILIVDDHAILREGLKRMLEATAPRWTIDEAANGHEALDRLRHTDCDVAILDISMPGMSGLDLLRRIRAEFPRTRVLMLSMYAEEQYAMRAFKAGATGYLTKDSATRELVAAVRKLVAGGVYVSASLAERLVLSLNGAHEDGLHAPDDRELDAAPLAAGNRPAEIAQALNISTKTVRRTRPASSSACSCRNAALIRYALDTTWCTARSSRAATEREPPEPWEERS
jgi:DNA-binding NarL/FixJ family response regulator